MEPLTLEQINADIERLISIRDSMVQDSAYIAHAPKALKDVDIATNEEWFLERVDHEGGAIDYEIKKLKSNGTEFDDNWIKVMGANAKSIANRIYRNLMAPTAPNAALDVPEGYVLVPIKITAEDGYKVALMGEFFEHVTNTDEDGNEYTYKVPVSWVNIKLIHDRIIGVAQAALRNAASAEPAQTVEPIEGLEEAFKLEDEPHPEYFMQAVRVFKEKYKCMPIVKFKEAARAYLTLTKRGV